MSDIPHPNHTRDALDELVKNLLICVGTVSLMINDIIDSAVSGRGAAGERPFDEVAHELILSAIGPIGARHRGADIEIVAAVIDEVTTEICENVFAVPDELLEAAEE